MTKDCDMPSYTNPKYVQVIPRDGMEPAALFGAVAGVAAIVAVVAFILAHIVVLVLGLVGIGVVVTGETWLLLRYFTKVSWTEVADWYIENARAAQEARLTGQPVPAAVSRSSKVTVEVEVVRRRPAAATPVEAPASRPAIAPPYRQTIPGHVITDDGQRLAIEAKQGGPTHAA